MAHAIYLTAAEQKLFANVPAALKKGWEVKDERLTFADTPEKQEIRRRNLHLKNAALQKVVAGKDTKGAAKVMQSADFNNLDEADAMELYYVMGPAAFSNIMMMMLQMGLKNDDDIKTFISNAVIRHELLVALNLPPKY